MKQYINIMEVAFHVERCSCVMDRIDQYSKKSNYIPSLLVQIQF